MIGAWIVHVCECDAMQVDIDRWFLSARRIMTFWGDRPRDLAEVLVVFNSFPDDPCLPPIPCAFFCL